MSLAAFQPVWLHSSLRADEQSRRRLESLRGGALENFFHYVGVRQSQLWLAVHRRHAPLFRDPAFTAIYRDLSDAVARELSDQRLHVIGLGPGGGQKESWLLEALARENATLGYTPVDASAELAWLSADRGREWGDSVSMPVVGDLSLLPDLPDLLDKAGATGRRVYTAFGIIQNFSPEQIFPWFRSVLRPGDVLLLSTNLAPVAAGDDTEAGYLRACRDVLPQYDNPETRRWLGQVLIDWGIAEYLTEPMIALEHLEGLPAFVARAAWRQATTLEFEGEPCRFGKGEDLRLFFSFRYTPASLAGRLAAHELVLGDGRVTPCGQEGVWRIQVAGT